ncbi:MAG: hypothetical protein AB8G22_12380 [Saprospiraceae bacterium]
MEPVFLIMMMKLPNLVSCVFIENSNSNLYSAGLVEKNGTEVGVERRKGV